MYDYSHTVIRNQTICNWFTKNGIKEVSSSGNTPRKCKWQYNDEWALTKSRDELLRAAYPSDDVWDILHSFLVFEHYSYIKLHTASASCQALLVVPVFSIPMGQMEIGGLLRLDITFASVFSCFFFFFGWLAHLLRFGSIFSGLLTFQVKNVTKKKVLKFRKQ